MEEEDIWILNCCRGRTVINKDLLKYLSQVGFSLLILIFSLVQIIRLDDTVDKSFYFSIVSLIIGVYLPQPTKED